MENQDLKSQYCNDELYKETARECKVSEELVEDIASIQSEFTKNKIKKGAFESIRYVYLGAIKARHRKIQQMNDAQGKEL